MAAPQSKRPPATGIKLGSYYGVARGLETRSRFARLYRQLNLSRAQIEFFESELGSAWNDLFVIDQLEARDNLAPEEELLLQRAVQNISGVAERVLGPAAVRPLQSHLWQKPAHDFVGDVVATSVFAETPLTVENADFLAQTIADLGAINGPGTKPDYRRLDIDTVLERVGPQLSSKQREILQQSLIRWKFSQTYRQITGTSARPSIRKL